MSKLFLDENYMLDVNYPLVYSEYTEDKLIKKNSTDQYLGDYMKNFEYWVNDKYTDILIYLMKIDDSNKNIHYFGSYKVHEFKISENLRKMIVIKD